MVLLAACEPTATPFPVDIPTPATATPTAGAPQPLRYALAENVIGSVQDRDLIESSAQVIELDAPPDPADLGSRYDLMAAYGSYADATPVPLPVQFSLIVYTGTEPLNNPVLADVILRGIDPAALVADIDIPGIQAVDRDSASPTDLKTQLANVGWPDGLDLTLTYDALIGTSAVRDQLQRLNIRLNLTPRASVSGATSLALVTWTTAEQRSAWVTQVGSEGQVLDLFALPISYWAIPGLTIRFSPQGWPIAERP
ncbi:MAG: hypothetical protein K8J31_21110 [Anaerolineae bacterium]|nr:hypothetical protein [Anaerolineae bacterium]